MPPRLSASALADHISLFDPTARRTVRSLRATILEAAPRAAEGIRFHVLCYYLEGAFLGSIGGNICMIEVKKGRVVLSFIRGAALPDPDGLLRGSARFKRFALISDLDAAQSPSIRRLVRAAARHAAHAVRDARLRNACARPAAPGASGP